MQDHAFEFQKFYEPDTIEYVCNIFKKKWLGDRQLDLAHRREKMEEFSDFEHASPAIVQILDKLCYINNKGLPSSSQSPEESALSLDELKGKADELTKLLLFLQVHGHNKLNLVIMSKLHGIDSLTELLKCYGNNLGNDQLLIKIQTNILKTIAICSRHDQITSQLLTDPENLKNLKYIFDIITEQTSLLKWNDADFLRESLVSDANLLEACFVVVRQLLIFNKQQVISQNPQIEQILKSTVS